MCFKSDGIKRRNWQDFLTKFGVNYQTELQLVQHTPSITSTGRSTCSDVVKWLLISKFFHSIDVNISWPSNLVAKKMTLVCELIWNIKDTKFGSVAKKDYQFWYLTWLDRTFHKLWDITIPTKIEWHHNSTVWHHSSNQCSYPKYSFEWLCSRSYGYFSISPL